MTMKNRAAMIIFLVVVVAAIGAAFFYVQSHLSDKKKEYAGGVYDYRKDPELVRTVETALSLHAVMLKLTSEGKDGKPTVRYAIESVSQVKPNLVEVRYRLIVQGKTNSSQQEHKKRFRRTAKGTWSAVGN